MKLYTWWSAKLSVFKELNDTKDPSYENWRLPTIEELISIIDFSKNNPASEFDISPDNFWSSTSYSLDGVCAWYVNYYNGYVGYGSKANRFCVRGVRLGENGLLEWTETL